MDFETLQLHAGQESSDAKTKARAVPIYATSSFTFDSADHAANVFAGNEKGNQYGRMHNPTVDAFVQRLVALCAQKPGSSAWTNKNSRRKRRKATKDSNARHGLTAHRKIPNMRCQ